jgi:predicted esterase
VSALGCALVRIERRAARGPARGTLLVLHADGADARQLLDAAERFPDLDLVAPQAPRARNPFLSSASPDDPRWRDYAGYAWFRRDRAGNPEPASFGDSLAQLEKLALELHEAGRVPVYLLGRGDGATLAAELHGLRPDLFAREPFTED